MHRHELPRLHKGKQRKGLGGEVRGGLAWKAPPGRNSRRSRSGSAINQGNTPSSLRPHKCEGQSYVTLGSASVDTNVFLARVAPHTCEGQSYVTLVLTSADPKVHPVGHALGSASVGTKVT